MAATLAVLNERIDKHDERLTNMDGPHGMLADIYATVKGIEVTLARQHTPESCRATIEANQRVTSLEKLVENLVAQMNGFVTRLEKVETDRAVARHGWSIRSGIAVAILVGVWTVVSQLVVAYLRAKGHF